MKDSGWILTLPRDIDVTALTAVAGSGGRCAVHGPSRGVRERLDTFDWRLHEAGLVLEFETVAGLGPRLRLLDREGGIIEVACRERPRFSEDLPGAGLRRRLAPLLDVRALMPRRRETATVHELRVQDRREKTVARLMLWRPGRRGDCVARLYPVRGFEPAVRKVARRLRKLGIARPVSIDPLWLAVDGGGAPGDVTGWKLALDPEARSDDALKQVLGHYAHTMTANVPGMVAYTDSEFLHDFRVGLRRSRTILRRVPDVFATGRLRPFLADMAWLSEVTGPARDADVHLLVFPDYAASLREDLGDALTPLFHLTALEQREAHAALAGAIDGARFKRRWLAWQRFLDTPSPRSSRQRQASLEIRDSARDALLGSLARITRQGRRIRSDSPPEAYHRLRKRGKDARYLIDAFGGFFDAAALRKTTRRLKQLQDLLGEHQDLDVHRLALLRMHDALAGRGELDGETHLAMEHLVKELAQRAARARKAFPDLFESFLKTRPRKAVHR